MGFLKEVITQALEFIYRFTGNYGWAIILLTLAVRLLLYPLTVSQTRSMAAMKELQPKLQQLQEKYRNNPQEYQQQLLKLYQTHGFNPFGGCLPILVQFPILIALFLVLRDYQFGTAPFLWLGNLSKPDPYYFLPFLTGLTQFVQMRMTPMDPSQQAMSFTLSALVVVISLRFPAGVALYWVASNAIGIVQQYFINRTISTRGGVSK